MEIGYKFEILVKQGHGKDRVVHSKFSDLVPKEILDENDASLNRPDQVCHSFFLKITTNYDTIRIYKTVFISRLKV